MNQKLTACLLITCVSACGPGEPEPTRPAGATPPGGAEAAGGHGESLPLGAVTLLGKELRVTKFGEIKAGVEGAFAVHVAGGAKAAADLNVYLWVEDRSGTQLSAPANGHIEEDHLHFHVMPKKGEPFRVVLRVRKDGADERAGLPLDGHGHEHPATPHDGILAPFAGADGVSAGHLELKLHDDNGDLELWLATDEAITRPFDLPLDAIVVVKFVDAGNREVELRARNRVKNEDEDGKANVRDGKTHYFIYPSQPGDDASWLQGGEFQSIVQVSWTAGGETYRSKEFVLTPHAHH